MGVFVVIESASNSAPASAISALSLLAASTLNSANAAQSNSKQSSGGSAAESESASGAAISGAKVASQTLSAISGLSPSTTAYLPPSSQASAYLTTALSEPSSPVVHGSSTGGGSTLTPAQIAAMTPAQLNALPSSQITGFSVAQTQALTATQLNGVNKSTLQAINAANLSNAQVSALSASTLANLTSAQVGALGATQLQSLSATQIGALSQSAVQSLNLSNLTAAQLSNLNAGTAGKFTATQVSSLTAAQLGELSASAVGGLTAAGVGSLSAATVAALSTKTLQALSSSAVAGLLANQATSLSTAQISSFSTAQLSQVGLVGAKGGLQFNLEWASTAGSAPSGFKNAAIAAATNLASTFTNPMIVNLQVGYGKINGQTVGAVAESESTGNYFSYSQVDGALQKDAGDSSYQKQADSTLTSTNPEPAKSQFYVSSAEQKALGLSSATGSALDGYVSLSSSTQFAFNGSPQGQQVDAIGAFMHEMTEVMGRVGSVGKAAGAGVYTPLDLFRYQDTNTSGGAAATQRAATVGGQADFFSINGGQTDLGVYNATTGTADYSDWSTKELGDPFGEATSGSTPLTGRDAIEMAAIGYNLSTSGKTLAGTAQSVSV